MKGCPLLPVLHWHHLLLLRWALQRLQVVLHALPRAATAARLLQR
jgi:predicted PP-loop superfamily ATPase